MCNVNEYTNVLMISYIKYKTCVVSIHLNCLLMVFSIVRTVYKQTKSN